MDLGLLIMMAVDMRLGMVMITPRLGSSRRLVRLHYPVSRLPGWRRLGTGTHRIKSMRCNVDVVSGVGVGGTGELSARCLDTQHVDAGN
jgi:hypothetical protein